MKELMLIHKWALELRESSVHNAASDATTLSCSTLNMMRRDAKNS